MFNHLDFSYFAAFSHFSALFREEEKSLGEHLVENVNVSMPVYTFVKSFGCHDNEEL